MKIDLDVTKFFTLPTKILGALAFSTGLMLFLPKNILEILYITQITEKYGSFIGIAFVISSSLVVVSLLFSLATLIRKAYSDMAFPKKALNYMKKMSDLEKAIVYRMYTTEGYMEMLPISEGVVIELANAKVISRTSEDVLVDGLTNTLNNLKFPYYLQKWVQNILSDNSELRETFKQAYEAVSRNSKLGSYPNRSSF